MEPCSMSSKPMIEFLKAHVEDGRPLAIEFTKGVGDLEGYAEPGMRAHLVDYLPSRDDVVELRVNYQIFEEFNRGLEKANYYDKDGKPTLTARDAGFYNVTETYYVMATDDPAKYFSAIDPALGLLQEWQNTDRQKSYVSFLEEQVASLRAQLNPEGAAQPARIPRPRM
jgi:hypothetical protein